MLMMAEKEGDHQDCGGGLQEKKMVCTGCETFIARYVFALHELNAGAAQICTYFQQKTLETSVFLRHKLMPSIAYIFSTILVYGKQNIIWIINSKQQGRVCLLCV